jgi:penicillin-binding protein 1A
MREIKIDAPSPPPPPPLEKPKAKVTTTSTATWIWGHIQVSLFLLAICGTLTISITASLYLLAALNLPDISSMADYQPHAGSLFFDKDGDTIGWAFTENRQLADLNDIPKLLINAFVAAEDARFFQHQGVDAWSIARALIHNIKDGGKGQGASTITQQVARSLLLSPEKTYTRKIKEAILAYRIDKFLSKNEILHIYLNQIYLGEGAYGVSAAARTYFGKSVKDLTLAEMSILAGLPQAPSRYSPFKHFERAKARQVYVLNRMAEDGYITPTAARKAYLDPLLWAAQTGPPAVAEYFVQQVKNYVGEKYGRELLNQGGLKIYTTLDMNMQKNATSAIQQGIAQWKLRQPKEGGTPQSALVCIEAGTGKVLALVGGNEFKASQFNRATQARRQPGSSFKPIIYATALGRGFTPNSVIDDAPIEFKTGNTVWRPKNYEGKFAGPITLRTALIHSDNIVTIKLLQSVGTKPVIKMAQDMGITSPLTPNLSLALGSSAVSLMELTAAYTVFADNGQYVTPSLIDKIVDRNGKVLEQFTPKTHQVLDPRVAYQITYILKGVIAEGTGKKAQGIPFAAGKTGTTDQDIDAWFIGYTPRLVTGVWIGYDKLQSLGKRETGGQAAAPTWLAFMNGATNYQAKNDFTVPEGITFVPIAGQNGTLEDQKPDNAPRETASQDNVPAGEDLQQEDTEASSQPQEDSEQQAEEPVDNSGQPWMGR